MLKLEASSTTAFFDGHQYEIALVNPGLTVDRQSEFVRDVSMP